MTKGNSSKYLKYAVGEILLVVIGILIALQINNWNTKRINRKAEDQYIMRITNELKSEIVEFESHKGEFEFKQEALNRIVKIWQSEERVLADSLLYINDFTTAGYMGPWYNEPVAWTQLVQTGDLKLLKNQELVDALFKYYDSVKKFADNFLLHPMNMTNKAREIILVPFRNVAPENYYYSRYLVKVPVGDVYDNIWKKRDEYLTLYMNISYNSKIQVLGFENILTMGKELLEKLEKQ